MHGTRTTRKLDEAKFFLDQLAPNYGKLKKFDYFLSAFISSARSVLWVMRNEYHDVPGWEVWYTNRKPDQAEADLLKGTNDIRIRTEKLGPLETASTLTMGGIRIPPDKLGEFRALMGKAQGKKIPVKLSGTLDNCTIEMEIEGERIEYLATEVILKRELDEFPDSDILAVCQRYFEAIKAVVKECHEKFNA